LGNTNNHHLKIYQFIDSSRIRNIDYINSLINCNAIICFDLEDSIKSDKNSYQQIRTLILRNISELICNNKISEIGIRINSSQSDYYQEDIYIISKLLNEYCHINFFLPKISTSSDFTKTTNAIHSSKIQKFEVIPIIESKNGMNNLKDILLIKSPYFSKIAFGHCDYNLDCDYFPFYHQDSNEYWNWVNNLTSACGNEITFLNSPYLKLNDDDSLLKILSRLTTFNNRIGQITLSLRQSKVCERFNQNDYRLLTTATPLKRTNNVIDYAKYFIERFNKFKIDGKNFALVPHLKELLSPQEYTKATENIGRFDDIKN
jgi:hypothetical protein